MYRWKIKENTFNNIVNTIKLRKYISDKQEKEDIELNENKYKRN